MVPCLITDGTDVRRSPWSPGPRLADNRYDKPRLVESLRPKPGPERPERLRKVHLYNSHRHSPNCTKGLRGLMQGLRSKIFDQVGLGAWRTRLAGNHFYPKNICMILQATPKYRMYGL